MKLTTGTVRRILEDASSNVIAAVVDEIGADEFNAIADAVEVRQERESAAYRERCTKAAAEYDRDAADAEANGRKADGPSPSTFDTNADRAD